jgi:hypothetical protein
MDRAGHGRLLHRPQDSEHQIRNVDNVQRWSGKQTQDLLQADILDFRTREFLFPGSLRIGAAIEISLSQASALLIASRVDGRGDSISAAQRKRLRNDKLCGFKAHGFEDGRAL